MPYQRIQGATPGAKRKNGNNGTIGTPHIPRPRNAFMIYRAQKLPEARESHLHLKSQGELSKVIGAMWRSEDPSLKAHFVQLALEEEKEHKAKYPDYKYQPRRKKSPRRGSLRRASGSSSSGGLRMFSLAPAMPSSSSSSMPTIATPLSYHQADAQIFPPSSGTTYPELTVADNIAGSNATYQQSYDLDSQPAQANEWWTDAALPGDYCFEHMEAIFNGDSYESYIDASYWDS